MHIFLGDYLVNEDMVTLENNILFQIYKVI